MARRTAGLTLLIAAVSTLGPFTIDSFFPSLRAISADLHVTPLQAQQLVTVFMLPLAFMSLVHGSLSDALGRRRVLMAGMLVYVVASLGCTVAPGFASLLLCRAVQGTVAGVGMIVGRAIVRDCYQGVQAQRVMSTITMTFALGPALAPVVGGWVHVWFGWRAVFGAMAVLGTSLLLLTVWRLPETHPPEARSPLHLGALMGNVAHVASTRRFQWMVASSVLCFVSVHAYIGSAPAIVLDHWQLSETQFAMLTVPIIGGYSLGAWFSGRMAGRVEPEQVLRWGYHGCLASTTAMLALQFVWPHSPVLLQQAVLACIATSIQLIFPIVTLHILDLFPATRGAASSAQSFCAMVMSALMMGVAAPWLSVTMQRLALCCFGLTFAGWLIWLVKLRSPAPDAAGDH